MGTYGHTDMGTHGYTDVGTHGRGDVGTHGYGDTRTWGCGDTWIWGHTDTGPHGHGDTWTWGCGDTRTWGHTDVGLWGPTLDDEVDLRLGDLGAAPHHLADVLPRVLPRHRGEVDGGDGEADAVLVGVCRERRRVGGRTDGRTARCPPRLPARGRTCELSPIVEQHQGRALLELPLDADVGPAGAVRRARDVHGCGERWSSAGGAAPRKPTAVGDGGRGGLPSGHGGFMEGYRGLSEVTGCSHGTVIAW